jgi:hypothetical protein
VGSKRLGGPLKIWASTMVRPIVQDDQSPPTVKPQKTAG